MAFKLECTCGEILELKDLVSEQIFAGNEIEPPEYRRRCPYCGQDDYEMDEYFEKGEEE